MNLFTASLELARRLTTTREGAATATATTYIDDTTKAIGVDEYNDGTIWIDDTTQRMLAITDTTATRITFAALAGAPTAGVRYAIANRDYPLDVLTAGINAAVRDLHARTAEDETLDTVSGQSEYTLPAGVSRVLRVEVETPVESVYIGPSGTYYAEHNYWHEIGSVLRFTPGTEPRSDGYAIRLTYRVEPVALVDADDEIPNIDYELMLWKATAYALRWGLQRYGQDPDRRVVDRLNEAQQEIARRGGNKRLYQTATKLGNW